ncbi:MAG: T9SS C-terminal target domain-containing protein [Tepidisphaeraceae bacterium]
MNLCRTAALSLLVLCTSITFVAASLRVDINADNDRRDMLSPSGENWRFSESRDASKTFDAVTATLRNAGTGKLEPVGWKGGIDSGALLTTDGVANPEGGIEIVLTGLAAGKHSLATFHNSVSEKRLPKCVVSVGGQSSTVQPTVRAASDYDAATAFVEFDARAGEQVVIRIQPQGAGGTVLNGFEIDAPDPARRAAKPTPVHCDEHAAEQTTLTWTALRTAASHHVYLGTSEQSVAGATPASPEFKGDVKTASYQPQALDAFTDYFWRVDEIGGDKNATKGDVWRFRVRRLAFPGAEGYGRFARGGRGGRVIEVTTLDDSGPGSLRDAVEADGPRTVIFRVGGTITLKSKLVIKNPCITLAGQTAPGDGICIRGYTFGNYATHDTIIRYVRIRVGDESGQTLDGTGFASSDHCIMDHVSVSWSQDEAVSSRGAKNITFQRSIVAQPLNVAGHAKYAAGKGHGFAGSISGNVGSFHHNLLAHCAGRNWSLAGGLTQAGKFAGYLDIRNNVVYNWEHRTNDGGVRKLNLVNNIYLPGPATRVFHLLIAEMEMKVAGDLQQYYVAGNVMEGKPQYDANNWLNGGVRDPHGDASRMKLSEPFCVPYVATQTPREAYESVMSDVGCNWPKLDAVDEQVMQDVAQRKATFKGSKTGIPGMIDSQRDAGGWPELKGGDAPADADHDGMPDAWETKRGLNPSDASDGNEFAKDGWTNLELYLNGIVPPRLPAARTAAGQAIKAAGTGIR